MTVRAMATTTWTHGWAKPADTFETLNPATSEVIATFGVCGESEVQAAVDRAHQAAAWWAGLPPKDRRLRLLAWKSHITRYIGRLAELVHAETGKPLADAKLEILLAIVHIDWAAKNAHKVLRPRRVRSGLVGFGQAATLEYQPLGVVGVIGPWNYPVFTPMGSIVYALAAGNAVVFKPSEYTPGVGAWLAQSFADVVPEQPVLQLITGFGETGAALCRSGVDKIAFTGSAATGKRVMAACAETLTPVVIEGGGKDSLLVDEDANLDEAADAAVWGGMFNAGQTCVGVERVYVHEKVHDEFVTKVLEKASDLRAGSDSGAKLGPITMPKQLMVIREHIADALTKGGRALLGGVDSVGDRFVQPTVLVDVPEDSKAVTDETFGPTITIAKVRDMDDAVAKANATRYGLGNTVFSRRRGVELAKRLRSGMVSVNSVISFAGIPSLPVGGVGESGFGRIHGPDGLREFARSKAIARPRFRAPLQLTTFSRLEKTDKAVAKLVTLLHGKR